MSEPWSLDYRGLAIVPMLSGSADAGYTASWKVNRATADGQWDTVLRGDCEGRYLTEDAAREAATDAAQAAVEGWLGASA